MKSRFILILMMVLMAGASFGQSRSKKSGAKSAVANPIGAWIYFNGGEDIKQIAVDSKNIYVAMIYTKRFVAIDKSTGKHKSIEADHEISSVAVADDKCYYYVDREGVFRYDAASETSDGPLFGITPDDCYAPENLYASQDGHYLLCGDLLVDVAEGHVISKPGGGQAVNNFGGVYISIPEAWYKPLDGEKYQVSRVGTAVSHFFPDIVTGNVYYCMSDGLGVSPMVPQPGVGVKKVPLSFETDFNQAQFITRDDEGNFVVSTNSEGIGFGGKSIEDPFKMEKELPTGLKTDWGSDIFYTSGNSYIIGDGKGNLIFGDASNPIVFIYNPNGINGYSEIKGKRIHF